MRVLRYDNDADNYSIIDRQFFGGSSLVKVCDLDKDGIPEIICTRPAVKENNPYILGPDSVNQAPGGIYIFHFVDDKLRCRAKQTSQSREGGYERMLHIKPNYIGFFHHMTPGYTAYGNSATWNY